MTDQPDGAADDSPEGAALAHYGLEDIEPKGQPV